jgi:glycosyltransferase involved in cell wall biosynthesis
MITVVIPVRNREHLIVRAIESVVAQTLTVDEIIVVDDASTDRTVEVVGELAKSLSNLTLVSLKENVGAARARNIAIEIANGDLIAFLDSDDVWYVDKLSKQVVEFDANKNVVAVFCGMVAVNPGTGNRYHIVPGPRATLNGLYHSNFLMTMSCALISKRALVDIGGFDESLPTCEDWDLFIRLAEIGKISVVQEELVEYLVHGGPRLSRDKLSVLVGHDALFEKIYRRIPNPRLKRKARASYQMRMADIFSTDYCFAPVRAIGHSCKALLLAPSREGLHSFRRVIKSLFKKVIFRQTVRDSPWV